MVDNTLRFLTISSKMGAKRPQGFSLIEIMVVMVIVGIILRFVVVSFGDFGASRRVESSTKHLASLIKLAHTKAIIGNHTYGLTITQRGYRFYRYRVDPKTQKGDWRPLERPQVFRENAFPRKAHVTLSGIKKHTPPQIIIKSSGSITPFLLTLSINKDSYRIQSKGNGDIETGDV